MERQAENLKRIVMVNTVILLVSIVLVKSGVTEVMKTQVTSKFNEVVLDKSEVQYKAVFYVFDAQNATSIKVNKFSSLEKYLSQTYNVPTSEFKLSREFSSYWCPSLTDTDGVGLSGELIDELQKCKCSAQQNSSGNYTVHSWDFVFENEELGVRILVELPPCED